MGVISPAIVLTVALATLVGVSLGLLGGGGSILTVPLLTYGVAMLHGRKPMATATTPRIPFAKLTLLGVGVGTMSGLVGAGGGFLLVPALTLVAGLPMTIAVGTSLVVIAMQSFAGLAGHLSQDQIGWRLAAMVTAAAVVGVVVGGRLAALINQEVLRRAFGWMVLAMAVLILYRESDPLIGVAGGALTLLAAINSLACSRYGHCPLRRLIARFRGIYVAPA